MALEVLFNESQNSELKFITSGVINGASELWVRLEGDLSKLVVPTQDMLP